MNKNILLILFLVLGVLSLNAQTKSAFMEAAIEAEESKNHYAALTYYQNVLEFDTTNIDIRYKVATAAKNFMAYIIAEDNYTYVVDNQKNNEYPEASYYLAYVQQMQGKYDIAKENYDLYLAENSGDDPYLTAKADKERSACEWAANEILNPDETIKVSNLGESINTEYSDFAPAIVGDSLYYSSMRYKSSERNVPRISKLLIAPNASNGTLWESNINESDFNIANATFNTDRSKIFYTVCERITDTDLRCDLYCRMVDNDGNLGEAKKLPEFINIEGFTNTQPTIGYDSEKEKEILYFVSDREGGKGKLDIWFSIIDNKDNFTAPMNLEDVNTASDELTPFYHIKSNTLYFSSNGYRSLGGYDVYQTKKNKNGFGEVNHLNNPINTSYHDIYFVIDNDSEMGYFASNRESARYIDAEQEACCFDLYEAKFLPLDLNLNAITFDKFSQDSLFGATVRLVDEDSEEDIQEILNEDGADHHFALERCRNYLVIGEKLGYKSDTIRISSCDYKKSEDILKKLYLEPEDLNLNVLTFDGETKEALNGATVMLYDMTDPDMAPITLEQLNSHQFNFPLIRGHEYRVVASKFGYSSAQIEFNTDNISGIEITKKLYLERDYEKSLSGYMPLKLFFDNDRPDPRTTKRTSTKTYSDTYNYYLSRQSIFVENSPNPQGMTEFFEYDVKSGYDKLYMFLDQLKSALAIGEKFELSIRGFASPRAQPEYNLILGQRRVFSVRNEIESYENGIFVDYIKNGQLIITDVSYGENLAPKDVNDSYKNEKLSIYSVEASKERRVEIIDVTQKEEE